MFFTLINYFTHRPVHNPLYIDNSGVLRVTVEPDLIDIEKGKYHQWWPIILIWVVGFQTRGTQTQVLSTQYVSVERLGTKVRLMIKSSPGQVSSIAVSAIKRHNPKGSQYWRLYLTRLLGLCLTAVTFVPIESPQKFGVSEYSLFSLNLNFAKSKQVERNPTNPLHTIIGRARIRYP